MLPTDSDEFFFPRPAWLEDLDLLLHLIRYSNVLIIVAGTEGVGKTTFIQQSQQQMDSSIAHHVWQASSDLTPIQLMKAITQKFGLPEPQNLTAGDVELVEPSRILLRNLRHAEMNCVCIVDDAHNLPPATLQWIMYFIKLQTHQRAFLHFVIVGDVSLESRLPSLTDEQDEDLLHLMIIEALNSKELPRYIQAYCTYKYRTVLTKKQVKQLTKTWQGNLNHLQLELDKLAQQPIKQPRLNVRWLPQVVGVALLMLVSFAVVEWLYSIEKLTGNHSTVFRSDDLLNQVHDEARILASQDVWQDQVLHLDHTTVAPLDPAFNIVYSPYASVLYLQKYIQPSSSKITKTVENIEYELNIAKQLSEDSLRSTHHLQLKNILDSFPWRNRYAPGSDYSLLADRVAPSFNILLNPDDQERDVIPAAALAVINEETSNNQPMDDKTTFYDVWLQRLQERNGSI
ncbi:MAG: hypothetical protein Tsb005_10110 [Gammaproteobacteria bacterium]